MGASPQGEIPLPYSLQQPHTCLRKCQDLAGSCPSDHRQMPAFQDREGMSPPGVRPCPGEAPHQSYLGPG